MHKLLRNRVLLLGIMIEFFLGFESGAYQLVLLPIGLEFGLLKTGMGALVTTQYSAILAMPLIFGRIADKIGKKKVLMAFIPILILGCMVAILAHSIQTLILGIFLIGTGYGIAEALVSAFLTDERPEDSEKNITLAQGFYSLGAVISPLVVQSVMEIGVNWRVAFFMVEMGFAVIFCFMLFVPFQKVPAYAKRSPQSFSQAGIFNPVFVSIVGCIFLYVFLENGFSYFENSFFNDVLHNQRYGAFALSLFWLCMAFSRIIFGIIKMSARRIVVLFFFLSAVALLLFAISSYAACTLIISSAVGFCYGPIWPVLIGIGTSMSQNNSGTASSIMMAFSGLGGGLSSFLLGLVADLTSMRYAILSLVFISLGGFLISFSFLHYVTNDSQH